MQDPSADSPQAPTPRPSAYLARASPPAVTSPIRRARLSFDTISPKGRAVPLGSKYSPWRMGGRWDARMGGRTLDEGGRRVGPGEGWPASRCWSGPHLPQGGQPRTDSSCLPAANSCGDAACICAWMEWGGRRRLVQRQEKGRRRTLRFPRRRAFRAARVREGAGRHEASVTSRMKDSNSFHPMHPSELASIRRIICAHQVAATWQRHASSPRKQGPPAASEARPRTSGPLC